MSLYEFNIILGSLAVIATTVNLFIDIIKKKGEIKWAG